ncbi:uncharacterized protein wu:fj16a03 [Takifugu flavidus]|uniref:Uncharacterized protein n=2 Tax=Takifugu TaxID=31032 RepID=A0A5C6PG68_9TELE|nr:uncharacterized protein wu:fj16a03 [Takifugu flavidus]TNM99393.1 hypothetical protein fugu_012426 [Takifugu bimaculatus]TWW78503.1 hypothetical protein D4764_11G0006240 [Takifugu flavidus]
MKVFLVLLLVLLPLCSAAKFRIRCQGEDFLMVRDMQLDCRSDTKQACYTRGNGEKGCTALDNCARAGWNCCFTDFCNA